MQKTFSYTKNKAGEFLSYLKNKLISLKLQVMYLIFSAYIKSLLVFT